MSGAQRRLKKEIEKIVKLRTFDASRYLDTEESLVISPISPSAAARTQR
jgi:hypothetical protein